MYGGDYNLTEEWFEWRHLGMFIYLVMKRTTKMQAMPNWRFALEVSSFLSLEGTEKITKIYRHSPMFLLDLDLNLAYFQTFIHTSYLCNGIDNVNRTSSVPNSVLHVRIRVCTLVWNPHNTAIAYMLTQSNHQLQPQYIHIKMTNKRNSQVELIENVLY